MEREIQDVSRAVRWAAQTLAKKYPEAHGELFLSAGGSFQPHGYEGRLDELLRMLVEFCDKLSRAWIRFDPDHPYGMVCKVVGHCKCPTNDCDKVCRRYYERPSALLTLTRVEGEPMVVGNMEIPNVRDSLHHLPPQLRPPG